MHDTRTFYADLPPARDLLEVLDPSRLSRVPDDWDLHLADVVDSTGAISRGRYRAVNLAAVLALVAARNASPVAVPFSFGGDGMVLAAPRADRVAVRAALAGIARRVRDELDIALRVGTLPVERLSSDDAPVLVGKVELAPWAHQAIFSGSGIPLAERLLKGDNSCRIPDAEAGEPDLAGFECRWDPVRPEAGEVLSLLVEAVQPELLRMVLQQVDHLFGPPERRNPVQASRLHLSWSWNQARREAALASRSTPKVWLLTQLGRAMMRLGVRQGSWNWGTYRTDLARACDFQKLEGSLRMVLVGGQRERERLLDWLAELENHGLRWGAHVSRTALVTCAVRDYGSDHIHFVDGSDGGYALASVDLKRRFPQAS